MLNKHEHANLAKSPETSATATLNLNLLLYPLPTSSTNSNISSPFCCCKRMQAALGEKAEGEGQFTGVGEMVPRLEKFHLAGTLVGRHDTFSDFEAYVKSLALTSIRDMSRKTCCKMLFAMAHPLKEQDMAVMRKESRPR